MPKHLASALLTGLLSSGLFLVVFGASLGFVFMFLPALPLFFLGLSRRARLLPIAIGIATLVISFIAGLASGVLFLIFLGLPAWYLSQKSLLSAMPPGAPMRVWYPIGVIMMRLTLYACVFVALIVWYYSDIPGGLPQLLADNIHEAFSDLEGDYGDVIDQMAGGLAFLTFPITIWLWGMLLYGHAWLAGRVLVKQHNQVRPDMAITLFPISSWMLQLIAIAALATLIGGNSMSFLGKSTLLSLMLPYFFLGCALMHRYGRNVTSYRFFIFFVYFLVLTQFWPVLILAGIGLIHQIKGLRADGNWFRS